MGVVGWACRLVSRFVEEAEFFKVRGGFAFFR